MFHGIRLGGANLPPGLLHAVAVAVVEGTEPSRAILAEENADGRADSVVHEVAAPVPGGRDVGLWAGCEAGAAGEKRKGRDQKEALHGLLLASRGRAAM